MPVLAPNVEDVGPEELRLVSVDFSGKLESGELLTGTPTVTETDGGSVLTLTNKVVNTAILDINGTSIAVGKAVQFLVDPVNGVFNNTYQVDIVCATDSSPSQDVSGAVLVHII